MLFSRPNIKKTKSNQDLCYINSEKELVNKFSSYCLIEKEFRKIGLETKDATIEELMAQISLMFLEGYTSKIEEDPYYYNVNLEPYYLDNLITDLDVFATSYSTIFFISNDKIEVKEYILERIDALKNKGYSDYKIFQIIHYRYLENMLEIQMPGMHYGSEMLEYIHTILPAEITHFYNL